MNDKKVLWCSSGQAISITALMDATMFHKQDSRYGYSGALDIVQYVRG